MNVIRIARRLEALDFVVCRSSFAFGILPFFLLLRGFSVCRATFLQRPAIGGNRCDPVDGFLLGVGDCLRGSGAARVVGMADIIGAADAAKEERGLVIDELAATVDQDGWSPVHQH